MSAPRLLLASRSPRRARLLREAGYAFEQCDPPFDDPPTPSIGAGQRAQDRAIELAARKALSAVDGSASRAVPALSRPGAIVLAADTLCIAADGSLMGTPTTRDEARTMIRSFVAATHDIITAVALCSTGCPSGAATFADTARVTFGRLNDDQIERYLDTGDWRGKAGGYNLFDRQHDGWPIHVQGDPTTVVGLPMVRLVRELARLGIHPVCRHGGPST